MVVGTLYKHCHPRIYRSIRSTQLVSRALADTLRQKPHYRQFIRHVSWRICLKMLFQQLESQMHRKCFFAADLMSDLVHICSILRNCSSITRLDIIFTVKYYQSPPNDPRASTDSSRFTPRPLALPRLRLVTVTPLYHGNVSRQQHPIHWKVLHWTKAQNPSARLLLVSDRKGWASATRFSMWTSGASIAFCRREDEAHYLDNLPKLSYFHCNWKPRNTWPFQRGGIRGLDLLLQHPALSELKQLSIDGLECSTDGSTRIPAFPSSVDSLQLYIYEPRHASFTRSGSVLEAKNHFRNMFDNGNPRHGLQHVNLFLAGSIGSWLLIHVNPCDALSLFLDTHTFPELRSLVVDINLGELSVVRYAVAKKKGLDETAGVLEQEMFGDFESFVESAASSLDIQFLYTALIRRPGSAKFDQQQFTFHRQPGRPIQMISDRHEKPPRRSMLINFLEP